LFRTNTVQAPEPLKDVCDPIEILWEITKRPHGRFTAVFIRVTSLIETGMGLIDVSSDGAASAWLRNANVELSKNENNLDFTGCFFRL